MCFVTQIYRSPHITSAHVPLDPGRPLLCPPLPDFLARAPHAPPRVADLRHLSCKSTALRLPPPPTHHLLQASPHSSGKLEAFVLFTFFFPSLPSLSIDGASFLSMEFAKNRCPHLNNRLAPLLSDIKEQLKLGWSQCNPPHCGNQDPELLPHVCLQVVNLLVCYKNRLFWWPFSWSVGQEAPISWSATQIAFFYGLFLGRWARNLLNQVIYLSHFHFFIVFIRQCINCTGELVGAPHPSSCLASI